MSLFWKIAFGFTVISVLYGWLWFMYDFIKFSSFNFDAFYLAFAMSCLWYVTFKDRREW